MALLISHQTIAQDRISQANLNIDTDRIRNADTEQGNWLAHGRTFSEQRFSPLNQINEENIGDMGLAWSIETGFGRGHEASPIVVDGVMFITLPWSVVMALDAETGETIWTYDPEVPREWGRRGCCDVVNRGAALWKGKLIFATFDGRLVGLDAKTGKRIWETRTTDPDQPYTITGAPRIADGKVVIGNGGGEYGVRGYITAYDAGTGEQAWRFYIVPGNPADPFEHPEMEVAAKTWSGTWWEAGGGGTAWDSMAYDPDLELLYVGTGNGSPWNREIRSPGGGDNLYLSSILAIKPDTGRLVWHYQTTPADSWDYTAVQHIMLADLEIEGRMRKVLMQAPKNSFFYVLDRETGELLSADKYIFSNWASHVDLETGRPVELPNADYKDEPKLIYPSPDGGHGWHPMAYNPATGYVYIPAMMGGMAYVYDEDYVYTKEAWNTGTDFGAIPSAMEGITTPRQQNAGYLKAWDPIEKREVWSNQLPGRFNGGLLSTAGNLLFQGTSDGRFVAYSADKGEELWQVQTNIGIIAPPVTYTIDGEQYIAVLAGWGGGGAIVGADRGISAATRYPNRGKVLAFKLGGNAKLPTVIPKRQVMVPQDVSGVSVETFRRGERLFQDYCFMCHGFAGNSAGVVADLRFSIQRVHDSFEDIVLKGIFKESGMASFADILDKEDVAAIKSYLGLRISQDSGATSNTP